MTLSLLSDIISLFALHFSDLNLEDNQMNMAMIVTAVFGLPAAAALLIVLFFPGYWTEAEQNLSEGKTLNPDLRTDPE